MDRSFADALQDAVRALNAAGFPYAVSGGVAMGLYGAPRFTKDVDVLVLADHDRVADVFRAGFRSVAPDAFVDSSGFVVDVYIARTDLERAMLDRATTRALGKTEVRVLDPNDWAALKLAEARRAPVEASRHLADVKQVDALVKLDRRRLEDLAERLDALPQLRAFERLA